MREDRPRAGLSLRIQDVCKSFKGRAALSEVSAEFQCGVHGLIGPDGAGKTTLLRVMAGLMRPSRGRVLFFEGKDRPLDFESMRPRLAYMPQSQSLYSDLSVGEHLDFFRHLHAVEAGTFAQRRERLLHLTRLTPFVDRPAGKLSGGMYKKLGLMCALIASPDVLLLDEPTNGVDPVSRREFWELLYELRQDGLLIVLSTSYMDEAERCDSAWVMDEGKIMASGPPREILERANAAGFADLFIQRTLP